MTSYVAQVNTGADALVSSRSVSTPGGVASGDVGVFWLIRWNESASFPTVTPPSGAVLRNITVNGTNETSCYLFRVNAETSFAFSWTGTRWSALAAQFFRGVDPALDLSTAPYQSATGAAAPVSTLTVTTTNTASLVWSVNTIASSSGITHSPPTNFTEDADVAPWSNAHYIATADGSQSASGATFSPSQIWIAALVALAPAASSIAVSGTDTGTYSESAVIQVSSSDSISSSEGQALSVTLTGTDSGLATDAQNSLDNVSGSDSNTGTENQTIGATLSSGDTAALAENQSTSATVAQTDSVGATEAQIVYVFSSDGVTATDTQSLATTISQADSASLQETWIVHATLTKADSVAATEAQHTSEPFGLTAQFSAPFSDTVLQVRLGGWQATLRTYTEDV